jgi:formate-dependent nitrite reductase cytochrome c552 subunit
MVHIQFMDRINNTLLRYRTMVVPFKQKWAQGGPKSAHEHSVCGNAHHPAEQHVFLILWPVPDIVLSLVRCMAAQHVVRR